jgi:hypothetical protein
MNRSTCCLILIAVLVLCPPARLLAASNGAAVTLADAGGPAWSGLNAEQRRVLSPLAPSWAGMTTEAKEKWIEMAGGFRKLPPAERQRIEQRMAQWARMSPEQRNQARLNFQRARQVPASERQARWEAYQALSPSQKKALAERAAPVASKQGDRAVKSNHAQSPLAIGQQTPKSNLVVSATGGIAPRRAVALSVVRADNGATTTLVTAPDRSPLHQQAGLPKIAAGPGFVDRTTLLPRRGLQGAGTSETPPSPVPSSTATRRVKNAASGKLRLPTQSAQASRPAPTSVSAPSGLQP